MLVLTSTIIVGVYIAHLKIEQTHQPTIISLMLEKEVLLVELSTAMVVMIITIVFAYTLIKPVDNLIIGTQLVAEGKLDHKIKKYTDDEIGRLVDAFNEMIIKLRASIQRESETSEAVQLEKTKAELILDSMADGVIVIDENNKIVLFNPSAEKIFDLNAKKVIGKHILHYMKRFGFVDTTYTSKSNEIAFNKKRIDIREFEIKKPSKKTIKTTFTPLKSKGRKILGNIIVIEDITKYREIENMKTEFVSTVSHELRTPLTSIKGYAALLVDKTLGQLTEKQERAVSIINKESDRLSNLINDILDLSKLEHGKIKANFEPINLEECLDNCPALNLIKKKGINFSKTLPKDMPIVHADKNKISQVFTNLLSNSAKFTSPEGNIAVRILDKKNEIKVSIKDTGIGVAKKDIPKLFNKFYQVENHLRRNQGGTGLGLPIVKEIIGLHHGLMGIESKLKKGTTISFTLPKNKIKDIAEKKCWEIRNCRKLKCPAYNNKDLRCWLHLGVQCKKKVTQPCIDKISTCKYCDIYRSRFE